MALLSNIDLMEILNHLRIPIVGIFSRNNLPRQKLKGLFIVNLDDFGNAGTHWTCFSTIDDNVVYWDSYGMHPPKEVDNYIKWVSGKKSYYINKIQVQYLHAEYCGWFCVAFLHYLIHSKYNKMSKLVDSFNDLFNSESLDDNYIKLLNYINKIMYPKITGGKTIQLPQQREYMRQVDIPKYLYR